MKEKVEDPRLSSKKKKEKGNPAPSSSSNNNEPFEGRTDHGRREGRPLWE